MAKSKFPSCSEFRTLFGISCYGIYRVHWFLEQGWCYRHFLTEHVLRSSHNWQNLCCYHLLLTDFDGSIVIYNKSLVRMSWNLTIFCKSISIVTVCVFVVSILFWFPQRTHYFWRVFRFLFMEHKQYESWHL